MSTAARKPKYLAFRENGNEMFSLFLLWCYSIFKLLYSKIWLRTLNKRKTNSLRNFNKRLTVDTLILFLFFFFFLLPAFQRASEKIYRRDFGATNFWEGKGQVKMNPFPILKSIPILAQQTFSANFNSILKKEKRINKPDWFYLFFKCNAFKS